MELLLVIGGIWLLIVIIGKLKKNRPPSRSTQTTQPPNVSPSSKQNTQNFRPVSKGNSNISFKTTTASIGTRNVPSEVDLEGLHDAFTGASLDKRLGLHQCQSCKVYYHTESLQILREANNSQCVSCQLTNIIAVIGASKAVAGRD